MCFIKIKLEFLSCLEQKVYHLRVFIFSFDNLIFLVCTARLNDTFIYQMRKIPSFSFA